MSASSVNFASTETTRAAAHLGMLIRNARMARNMTQAELAVRSKSSPATVLRVEKGSVEAGLGAVLLMMEQLGLLKHIIAITDPATQALLEHKSRKRARRPKAPDLDF